MIGTVGIAFGVTLRVPEEYATIQGALDSLQDGDTVLVAVGVYAEALRGPPRSAYVLKGDVIPDTGNYPRPVVDPSTLPRPDTVTCLILNPLSANIVLEDFAFRNGREMYDSIPRSRAGGVSNFSRDLTVRRCLFDSTYYGVGAGTNLTLEDCRFEWNRVFCARTNSGPIVATNCLFSCVDGGLSNVVAYSNSSFRNCVFRDNHNGQLLFTVAACDSVLIEDCVFGPYGPNFDPPLQMWVHAGNVVRNCVFTGCQLGVAVLGLTMYCNNDDPLPVTVTGNVFENYQGGLGYGGAAIVNGCQDAEQSVFWGVIENNTFQDGSSNPANPMANAVYAEGKMMVRGNRFARLDPPTHPDVQAYRVDNGPLDTLTLRENLFDASGLAASVSLARIDARWNWWGDSTGPYHPSLNPDGQGGEVGNGVIFDPWYPDTSFLSAPRPRTPLPQAVSLDVYPNPFNATATLKLIVNEPGIFKIDLFNLLGQHVRTIWSGAVAYEKQIAFDGKDLSSGLYFVRVFQPIENRVMTLHKLIIAR
jgi:hypothetical protein